MLHKNLVIFLVTIGLFLAIFFVVSHFNNKPSIENVNPNPIFFDDSNPVRTAEHDLSYEKDQNKWLIYNNQELGFSFKYPSKYKDVSAFVMAGDTGEIFIGGAFTCNGPDCQRIGFTFGGATSNYSAVKGEGYTFNGFNKVDGRYYFKDSTGKSVEITDPIIEIKGKNINGFLIKGTDTGPGFPGYFGVAERHAYFNLRHPKFKGIIFISDITMVSDEELLAILSTFSVK